MDGKRERLADLLDRAGILRALLWARKYSRKLWLPVLTYHRIAEPTAGSKFDRDVIDATPDQFDRQIAMLARHFQIVGTAEVADHVSGRARLPPNALAITFDDGYLDCHDTALPILRRHGVKAVFFIATSYTSERRLYWWESIHYALSQTNEQTIAIEYPERVAVPNNSRAPKTLTRLVKTTRGLDVDRFLSGLFSVCNVEWSRCTEVQLADQLVMTWDHIRALRDAGMDVQSHTRTHRVLGTVPPDELDDELGGSREELAAELGTEIRAVAYPVGHSITAVPGVAEAIRRAGYEMGFTNGTGMTPMYRWHDPFDLRRYAMDVTFSDEYLRGMLAVPALARVRR